jgi:two-component system phosphate regulon response regulator OmpR
MEPPVPHILVVDDDKRLRQLLDKYLSNEGYRVTQAKDATDARAKLASIAFDLLVLDIMMPGESGLDLTRGLRLESAVPILLLTAMGERTTSRPGTGADDYLPKPFEPRELVLRIQAILKRAQAGEAGQPRHAGAVKFGPYVFEIDRRRLFRSGEPIYLTESENELLFQLARRAGNPVPREELSGQALPEGEGENRQIDVQMNRLRRKIEDDPRFPRYLQTVRGRGYVLQPD